MAISELTNRRISDALADLEALTTGNYCHECGCAISNPNTTYCTKSHRTRHKDRLRDTKRWVGGDWFECPTPHLVAFPDRGAAMITAAHTDGGHPYLCGCGSYHLWPSNPPNMKMVPYCLWCAAPLPLGKSYYCTRTHSQMQRKVRRIASAAAEPCPTPEKNAYEYRGTARLWAENSPAARLLSVYLCRCGMYHLTAQGRGRKS